jgi:hypothetical protein
MAATAIDLVSLDEARAALNVQDVDWSLDSELESYITAVSQRLDDLCGPIVKRTVTDEQYPGGGRSIVLRQAPASPTAASEIISVTEYASGTAQTLTAEGLTTSTATDYDFDPTTGILHRRSTWSDGTFGAQRVKVTYLAGRYDDTFSVAPKFKQAAVIMLSHLWRAEQGVGGSSTFGVQEATGIPTFGVPNAVLELLADERRAPAVA